VAALLLMLRSPVQRGFVKDPELVVHAMLHIGIAEVGHERDLVDLGQGVQPRISRTKRSA
jgi:hypothetical protein